MFEQPFPATSGAIALVITTTASTPIRLPQLRAVLRIANRGSSDIFFNVTSASNNQNLGQPAANAAAVVPVPPTGSAYISMTNGETQGAMLVPAGTDILFSIPTGSNQYFSAIALSGSNNIYLYQGEGR